MIEGDCVALYARVSSDGQARDNTIAIVVLRDDPKNLRIDDAEVVGDLVAVDMPVPRHLLAQKS